MIRPGFQHFKKMKTNSERSATILGFTLQRKKENAGRPRTRSGGIHIWREREKRGASLNIAQNFQDPELSNTYKLSPYNLIIVNVFPKVSTMRRSVPYITSTSFVV